MTLRDTTSSDSSPARPDGTQVIRRVAALLRRLAHAGASGASLAELSRAEALPRSTVHRMLGSLVDEGLVAVLPDKRYQLGQLVHELSLAAAGSLAEVARWKPAVDLIAARTGATTYLMRRSGVEAVCVAKADGHGVLRFVPVEVGQRRPLGVGAGALVLLAALDDDRVAAVIRTIEPGLKQHPRITAAGLLAAVQQARATGFAVSHSRVVDNGFGIGCLVPARTTPSSLAVSIAVHVSAVNDTSVARWKQVIADELQAQAARQQALEGGA